MHSFTQPKAKKHVILFFDVNDTMFIGDSAKHNCVEIDMKELSIMKMLAETYSSVWDASVTTDEMTYREFIEKYLYPGNNRDSVIQQNRNSLYANFIHFLTMSSHPLLKEVIADYVTIKQNLSGGYIPQAFINLVSFLVDEKIPFTIIFRTFGNDTQLIENELARRTSINKLGQGTFAGGSLIVDGQTLTSPEQMLRHIKSGEHAAWQDDFKAWEATGESYRGGKPYPVEFDNDNQVVIFYDDNVKKKIISAQPVASGSFNQEQLQQVLVKKSRIVPVDTYRVCLESNYFINSVQMALQTSLKLSDYLALAESEKHDSAESPLQRHSAFATNLSPKSPAQKTDDLLAARRRGW